MIILLDAGPLGRISNPKATNKNKECYEWMVNLIVNGVQVFVPEITDYEIRRELIRANKIEGIKRLNLIKNTIGYLPLNTSTMLKAAELWADARKTGKPTADNKSLDCDVILAAQAIELDGLIATENIGHLSRLTKAELWNNIKI